MSRYKITARALIFSGWLLSSLACKPAARTQAHRTVASNPRQAYLVFAEDTLRVSGSGGCNSVAGRFELDQDHLHFGPMASTRMACPDNMDLERQFLEALIQVARYRPFINNKSLAL